MAIDKRYLNCEYIPEGSYNEAEDGITYTWNDFLNVAKGNEKLAMMLIDTCDWQYPETEIDQLLRIGEIIEHNGKYVMPYDDDGLEQLWEELSDVPVYEDEDGWLCLENDWFVNDWFFFPSGTEREEIWYWFDEHYSKGVHALMFPSEH